MDKDQPEENQDSHEGKGKKRDRNPDEEEKRLNTKLNLNDLGAGYNQEEKRVARAIKCYQEQLIPFVIENKSMFARSGFLDIRGYGTNIKDININSHRSSPIDHAEQDRGLDRSRYKRPRYST